jgi:hypothetical protein
MPRPVPNTPELARQCICGRCPTYPKGDKGFYCSLGVSDRHPHATRMYLSAVQRVECERPWNGGPNHLLLHPTCRLATSTWLPFAAMERGANEANREQVNSDW